MKLVYSFYFFQTFAKYVCKKTKTKNIYRPTKCDWWVTPLIYQFTLKHKDHQISARPHSFPTGLALLSAAPASVSGPQQSRWCRCCLPVRAGPGCWPESANWSKLLCKIRKKKKSISFICVDRISLIQAVKL